MNEKKLVKHHVFVVVILIVGMVLCFYIGRQNRDIYARSWFDGRVISYEQSETGLVVEVQDVDFDYVRKILVTDTTMFEDENLMNRIFAQEPGLNIRYSSNYWKSEFNGIYPATDLTWF